MKYWCDPALYSSTPQTLHREVQTVTVFPLYSFVIRCLCNVCMGGVVGMKTKILLKEFSCNVSQSDLRSLRH